MHITTTLTSQEGAIATVETPFQVTNCVGLGFNPRFEVSTSGHTSRSEGASLDARLIYPLGKKLANVKNVRVELPKQLPSRLTTLQQACPDHVFNESPETCPAASRIGQARASTPILPNELEGWAYFVSHGGAAFPNLVVVLQDRPDGVRVDLIGETFISKAGITSTTFGTVPDVPISEFELYLPEGPLLGARRQRQPLHSEGPHHADRLQRPERRRAQAKHATRRHRLPQGQKGRKARKARRARTARHHNRNQSATTEAAAIPVTGGASDENPELTAAASPPSPPSLQHSHWRCPANAAFTHNYLFDITEVPASSKATVTGRLEPWSLAPTGGDLYV